MQTKLRYAQLFPVYGVLSGWWSIEDLPLPFQRQLIDARKALQNESETLEQLRQRLLDKYAVRGEDGQRVTDAKGIVALTDEAAFDAEWNEFCQTEFACPGIVLADFEALCGYLKVSPARLEVLLGDDSEHSILVAV